MIPSFYDIDKRNKGEYYNLLQIFSKLSSLFSDSKIPYINYRIAENIFCKSFNAVNLSRSDTAFDAKLNINGKNYGIGLKTFKCENKFSSEKIAEFNSISSELSTYNGLELAEKLSIYRNQRINLAKRVYNIDKSFYHIVARRENKIILFETDYEEIKIEKIKNVLQRDKSIAYRDENNQYNFNFSKSTLYRKFYIPEKYTEFNIEILEDPYALLTEIFSNLPVPESDKLIKGVDFVILPLYGRNGIVYTKSALNQWNAGGRERDYGEVYIPVPKEIHKRYPNFFPKRDEIFKLETPDNKLFDAKLCQENSKAIMTNPNKALSDWLLRQTLQLNEGEIATKQHLDRLGLDSVIIYKEDSKFKIDIMKTNSYEEFLEN